MPKKVLITGISGFVGSFLAEHLVSNTDYQISGTYLSKNSTANLSSIANKLHLEQIDLKDKKAVFALLENIKPDLIFHLAALSAVGQSFDNPEETIVNNIVVQLNLLEAVQKLSFTNSHILIVSSADVYGKVAKEDLPIDEETKFYPTNAYAVSKIAQDYLGLQYYAAYGLKIIRARPFNHTGPRQASGFVIADWAQKIALIEKGKVEPILQVGNLDAKRDFTDVRDMVKAYALLIEKGKAGDVYNIGSDTSYKISEILEMLLSLSTAKITVSKDLKLIRPEDSPERICNSKKFRALTGWIPKIPMKQTLKDTLDYWRDIV